MGFICDFYKHKGISNFKPGHTIMATPKGILDSGGWKEVVVIIKMSLQ